MNNASFTVTATGRVVVSGNLSGSISLSQGAAVLFQSHTGLTLPAGWSVSAQAGGGYSLEYQAPPQKYTVTFDLNGGYFMISESEMKTTAETVVTEGERLGLADGNADTVLSTFFPSGVTAPVNTNGLKGWNTERNGTGTDFDLTAPITGNMTLYAQWIEEREITVKLRNGDLPVIPILGEIYATDDSALRAEIWNGKDLTLNAGDSLNYLIFMGLGYNPTESGTYCSLVTGYEGYWNTKADGTGEMYTEGTPIAEDVTLYLCWKHTGYMVLLKEGNVPDHNGEEYFIRKDGYLWQDKTFTAGKGASLGTKLPTLKVEYYNKSGNLVEVPGYEFTGWNTKADGTGTTYTADTPINEVLILYAQWSSPSPRRRKPSRGQ